MWRYAWQRSTINEPVGSQLRSQSSGSVELDDELCLCFHVTKRKVINYLRVEKPSRPGQLSDCFGAGTGCGWCRPFLRRLFDEYRGAPAQPDPTTADYATGRAGYIRAGHGTPPPGATPIECQPPAEGEDDAT
jgi:bacterioferritin-associated ferredoxin